MTYPIVLADRSAEILYVARKDLNVREGAQQNTGLRVEAIQKWCGGQKGESWCCYWLTMKLDQVFLGAAPIPRQGGVQAVREFCQAQGWRTATPQLADLFVYVNAADHGHHIGFYTGPGPTGIAGNTDASGTSANGDRVAEHALKPGSGTIEYFSYPR